MHDGVRLELCERGLNLIELLEVPFEELSSRIDRGAVAFGQIVENADRVPLIEQQLGADAPNVASSADDQNLHRASCGGATPDVKRWSVRWRQRTRMIRMR
jgi:hypothetical protein